MKPKWNEAKANFFTEFINLLSGDNEFSGASIETIFKTLARKKNIKPGELQLPMRIMLVGGKFGPAVFEIAAMIGKEETINRIQRAIPAFKN